MGKDALLNNLIECTPVEDTFVTDMTATFEEDVGICKIVGWQEQPVTFREDNREIECILVTRLVMTIPAFRDFIERSAHNLKQTEAAA